MLTLKRGLALAAVLCAIVFSATALHAHLSEYIFFDTMLSAPDQLEVELSTSSLSEIGLVQFNYAGGGFDTYSPSSNGIFDPGTSGTVVSITINGQTIAAGSSGVIYLPSGNDISLYVDP